MDCPWLERRKTKSVNIISSPEELTSPKEISCDNNVFLNAVGNVRFTDVNGNHLEFAMDRHRKDLVWVSVGPSKKDDDKIIYRV